MAKAVIINTSKSRTYTASLTDYPIATINDIDHDAKITDVVHSAKPETIDYSVIKITDVVHTTKAISILPFYVKFTNIGIPGYGPNIPPPIGIAIVGVNNYIL